MSRTIATALFCIFLLAPAVEPQATVTALARGLEPLEESTDVRLTRFADFTDEDAVRIGMELEPGDLLASGSGAVDLELECAGGSVLRFTGSFRVLVDVPGDGVDCAVNFLSGTVDVLTDEPTEIEAGGVVLGSEGTQYTVVLVRRSQKPELACQVYDGRVEWRFPKGGAQWLDGGHRLRIADRKTEEVTRISARQISSTALRYARFDVAKARASGQRIADATAATRDLARVHEQVLARPHDTQMRVDLAKTQLQYSLSRDAGYNLRAGGVSTDEQLRLYKIDARHFQPSGTKTLGNSPHPLPPSVRTVPSDTQDPWTLVQQKKFTEAVRSGKKKVEAGTATSRDYYALAFAYRELEGRRSRNVTSHADRAIRLAERDRLLRHHEIEDCKKMVSGY